MHYTQPQPHTTIIYAQKCIQFVCQGDSKYQRKTRTATMCVWNQIYLFISHIHWASNNLSLWWPNVSSFFSLSYYDDPFIYNIIVWSRCLLKLSIHAFIVFRVKFFENILLSFFTSCYKFAFCCPMHRHYINYNIVGSRSHPSLFCCCCHCHRTTILSPLPFQLLLLLNF